MKAVMIACVLAVLSILAIPSEAVEQTSPVPEPENRLLLIEEETGEDTASEPVETAEIKNTAQTETLCDALELRLLCGEQTHTVSMGDYLAQVVLAEMPADFQLEALKAQAVAARTFTLKQMQAGKHADADICSDSACCQAWLDEDALRAKYGDGYDDAIAKAQLAVEQSDSQVAVFDGALIDATYFSCSGGTTEAAVAVWGSEVPYLQSVESLGEGSAAKYESEVSFTADELRALLRTAAPEIQLTGEPSGWFGAVSYTEGGGVDTMQIGDASFTGVQLRTLLGLNATKFTVSTGEGTVTFHVLGYGHRVGMSQYGADFMAENGFSYEVILQYYYQGIQIKKLSRTSSGQQILTDIRTGLAQTSE